MTRKLENRDAPTSHAFDWFIQVLIVISIITFSIETLPGLSARTHEMLHLVELVIVGIFTIEYLFRIFVAESKPKYLFSFYGVIDFLAIAPYYLFGGLDLRSLRAFRLFRLFRLFKLVRYNQALNRFGAALRSAREELIVFSVFTLILLYLSAVGIYYFENPVQPEQFKSVFHSLWWSVATLTTVGYGDIYPITPGGKLFTFVVLMLGLGVVAVPAGILASALSSTRGEGDSSQD